MLFLYGYGPLLWTGTKLTIALAILSMLVAFIIGLLGAGAKLSPNPLLKGGATAYTTVIRGVPDLLLMLLLFYSGQVWLNNLTEWLQQPQINIDPFTAGVVTIGFIYGAYFTETFRGAFLSVPKGQIEAGFAFGLSSKDQIAPIRRNNWRHQHGHLFRRGEGKARGGSWALDWRTSGVENRYRHRGNKQHRREGDPSEALACAWPQRAQRRHRDRLARGGCRS